MGLYPSNGNKKVAATSNVPENTPGIIAKKPAVIEAPDEALTKKKYVVNTQNNATGVNVGRLATVVSDLKGFAEGSNLTVTYYKQHYSETDVKGRVDDSEFSRNNVHQSVLKINAFEIRLTAPLTYEHNTENAESKLTGEAFTYPGFKPESGDRFVMEVDTGQYALMKVLQTPTRTSIRAATYFKIQFAMLQWMDEETHDKLEEQVTDEAWFDKTRFLAEPGALLYHDEYVEIKFLQQQRAKMLHYFKGNFLDEIMMYSYVRPDTIYDPYVTDFLLNILDFQEAGHMATQLYEAAPYLKSSIWTAMMDKNIPLESVPTLSVETVYQLGSKSVLHNSLLNKPYIHWTKSQSLADYFADVEKDESVYKAQVYPVDFAVTSSSYVKTTDTYVKRWKTYYKKESTGLGPAETVYVVVQLQPDEKITTDLYEYKATYGFKPNTTYYVRVDGAFIVFDTTGKTPDATTTYYVKTTTSGGGGATEGTIPADPTVPEVTEGDADEEGTLGDLLLHIHPHYAECPLIDGSGEGDPGTHGALDMVLAGSNDHIDLMRLFLKERKINLEMLHACIENVWKLTEIQKFYKMPIYIFLAQKALAYIHAEENVPNGF